MLSTDTEGPQQASRERFFSSDVSAGYIFLVVLSISYTRAQSVMVEHFYLISRNFSFSVELTNWHPLLSINPIFVFIWLLYLKVEIEKKKGKQAQDKQTLLLQNHQG